MDLKNMLIPSVAVGVVLGLFFGIVSAIPVLNICTLPCCLWITAGGFAAAHIYSRKAFRVEIADGAVVGALFGAVYAVVLTITGFLAGLVVNMLGAGAGIVGGQGAGNALAGFGVGVGAGIVGAMIGLVFNLFAGVFFGALGAVLYVAVMGKK